MSTFSNGDSYDLPPWFLNPEDNLITLGLWRESRYDGNFVYVLSKFGPVWVGAQFLVTVINPEFSE